MDLIDKARFEALRRGVKTMSYDDDDKIGYPCPHCGNYSVFGPDDYLYHYCKMCGWRASLYHILCRCAGILA